MPKSIPQNRYFPKEQYLCLEERKVGLKPVLLKVASTSLTVRGTHTVMPSLRRQLSFRPNNIATVNLPKARLAVAYPVAI